jgi:hypothetical protein
MHPVSTLGYGFGGEQFTVAPPDTDWTLAVTVT